jgi:hypothetical protein
MPADFTNSPKFLKGALVAYDSQTRGSQPRVIAFQYNPEQMKRTLEKKAVESKGGASQPSKEDVLRAAGPPAESIQLSIVLDAADQLSEPDRNQAVVEHGLYPVLSTLEMLLYPPTSLVREMEAQAGQGQAQISPADLPLVLLVWGKSRVVPVLLSGFTISEESFDTSLNPIRAKVDLSLKVLTYLELKKDTIGYDSFLSYQRAKEQHSSRFQSPSGAAASIQQLLPNA